MLVHLCLIPVSVRKLLRHDSPYCPPSQFQGSSCFVLQVWDDSRDYKVFVSTFEGDPLHSRPQISCEIHYLQKTVDCSSILIKASCNYHSRIYLPSSWIVFLIGSRCRLYFIGLHWLPIPVWFYWQVLLQTWNILAACEMLHSTGKCELKAVDVVGRWRRQGVNYGILILVYVFWSQSFCSQDLFFPLHF